MVQAVLFDYGGVLADVIKPADGPRVMAEAIAVVVGRSGSPMSVAEIEHDLELGVRAYEGWKRALSRSDEPVEISQRQFWDLTCCDWPQPAREAVLAAAAPLSKAFDLTLIRRPARPDARAVLECLSAAGIRTGLVSNCLSGWAARQQLSSDGLDTLLDVQYFSDEFGFRKPGAAMIRAAMAALGCEPGQVWLVGDRLDRDILAGRRAGVAATVLVRTAKGAGASVRGADPDHCIFQLTELVDLLGLST